MEKDAAILRGIFTVDEIPEGIGALAFLKEAYTLFSAGGEEALHPEWVEKFASYNIGTNK